MGRLNDISSQSYDSTFRRTCCAENGGCDKYLMQRPAIPTGPPDTMKCIINITVLATVKPCVWAKKSGL